MVSIIVVTYNRKFMLQECIKSLLSQNTNEDFEIIIVDNCSCDNTEVFLRKQSDKRIKFIRKEHRVNIWDCKKSAVEYSSGDAVAFIDDDCMAESNWLKIARNSLNNFDFVGGVVLPAPETKFPWWWRESLNWQIGINTQPGEKYLPLGSNIVFKKYVLETLNKDKQYCILGDNELLPYGEDNYRIKKALFHRFLMGINPKMIVYHHIPLERLRIAYLLKRSYQEGRALDSCKNRYINLFFILISAPYYLVRLFLSLDINYIFRIIANTSFLLHYIIKHIYKKYPRKNFLI